MNKNTILVQVEEAIERALTSGEASELNLKGFDEETDEPFRITILIERINL